MGTTLRRTLLISLNGAPSLPLHSEYAAFFIVFYRFLFLTTSSHHLLAYACLPSCWLLCAVLWYCPQLLYPGLMFVTAWRTILVRVRPDDLVVFKPCIHEDLAANDCRCVLSRVKTDWKEGRSLFSWADKGQWHTVQTSNEDTRREGDQFRIGFEPLYVDFTKSGAWFVVISLGQVCERDKACF